jgi:predicted nucleotidyltransferase
MDISVDMIRDMVSQWAKSKGEIQRFFLFGSRARQDGNPASDIDIALAVTDLNGESAGTRYFCNKRFWKEELQATFGRPVSMVRLVDDGRAEIQEAVARDGILLYQKGKADQA